MNPYLAEFIGTLLLILLGNGVVAGVTLKGTKSEGGGYLMVCLAWGLAVMLGIYAAGRISGAHINPAVTIALVVSGDFPASDAAGYMLAQLAGAFTGAVLVYLHYYTHWKLTPDPLMKLGTFCTTPAMRSPIHNLFSEFLGTLVLTLGVLFIGANEFTEGLNPIVLGALVTSIGFGFGGTTGFAINPARDLGPRIAHAVLPIPGKGSSDWSYSWIPVVGPLLGGATGAWLYTIIF